MRVKWVRQRCHTAPSKTEPMASVRPAWESDTMSLTSVSPRALSPLRNALQAAPSSAVTTSMPKTSRCPSELTPVAMTQHKLTMRPASRHLTTSASSHMQA